MADAVMRMPEPGVQRQVEPEEEEEERLQAKPLVNQITPLVQVQRQEEPEEEEEEETLQAKPLVDQITPLVQRQVKPEEEEEDEELQAKATSDNISKANPNLESYIQSLKGGGQPLSENDRAFFEPRFSADFSAVKVHTNSNAVHLARSVNAKAFTVGQDVIFGPGQFSPETTGGKKLLAHELTHVVQQNGGDNVRRKRAQTTLPELAHMMQPAPASRIQRVPMAGKQKKGSEELEVRYDSGPYVIEACRAPVKVNWNLDSWLNWYSVYATASQYSPRQIYGFNASPHTLLDNKLTPGSGSATYKILTGVTAQSKKGEGSTKVHVFKGGKIKRWHLEVYGRFDTVPMINKSKPGKWIHPLAYDMNKLHHEPLVVTKGSTINREVTITKTFTDGYTLSKSRMVTKTISSSISSEIGVGGSSSPVSAKLGSTISAQQAVQNAVGTSITSTFQKARTLKVGVNVTGPARKILVPTAKVYQTPVNINRFDATGKVTKTEDSFIYTVIWHEAPAVLDMDAAGNPILP